MTFLIGLAVLPFALFGGWLILTIVCGLLQALFESETFVVLLMLGGLIWFVSSGVWIPWIYG